MSRMYLLELVLKAEIYEREIGAQSCLWDYLEHTFYLKPEDSGQDLIPDIHYRGVMRDASGFPTGIRLLCREESIGIAPSLTEHTLPVSDELCFSNANVLCGIHYTLRLRIVMPFGHPDKLDSGRPLLWYVLRREPEQLLLHCTRGVHILPYDRQGKRVSWETSEIRRWLNDTFFRTAFTAAEQSAVVESRLPNVSEVTEPSPKIHCIDDKVFLLSEEEIRSFGKPKWFWERRPVPPLADRTSGVWWLRSFGRLEGKSMGVVRDDGVIYPSGDIRADDVMIVPALRIKTDRQPAAGGG